MSKTIINKTLKENYKIQITESLLSQLIIIVRTYEVRGEHPLALNTPLLGVHKLLFLKNDQDIIFDLFSKNEKLSHPQFRVQELSPFRTPTLRLRGGVGGSKYPCPLFRPS